MSRVRLVTANYAHADFIAGDPDLYSDCLYFKRDPTKQYWVRSPSDREWPAGKSKADHYATVVARRTGNTIEYLIACCQRTYDASCAVLLEPRKDPAKWWSENRATAIYLTKSCQGWQELDDPLGALSRPRRPVEAVNELRAVRSTAGGPVLFKPTRHSWVEPQTIAPREWLHDHHYIRKFVSGTISPGGVGKSALMLVEAISMATGRGLLTGRNSAPLRVWYWNGEDPDEETQRRVAAICKHYGITSDALGGRLFLNSGRDCKIIVAQESRGGLTIFEPVREALISALVMHKIDVFMVDPFVSTHSVSENDNQKINAVANEFRQIADRANCSVEIVHHARKTGGAEVGAEDARGGAALVDAFRSARVLNQMTEQEAPTNLVDPSERRQYFRMDDGKVNLTKYASAKRWFKLHSVALGNARPGLAGDEIGVVTTWTKPDVADGLPANAVEIAQKAVAAGEWRAHVNAKEKWVGRPIAEALGMNLDDKMHKARVLALIKEWTEAGYLRVTIRPDGNGDDRPFCINGNPWWP